MNSFLSDVVCPVYDMSICHIFCKEPFVRTVFGDCTATTLKAANKIAPLWNETLVFDDVVLYGDPEQLKITTMDMQLEIYDHDASSVHQRCECLFRCASPLTPND